MNTLFKGAYSQPYVLLVMTTFFWGGNAIAGKLAVGHISPFLLTSLRWALAMAIIYPFAIKYLRQDWFKIKAHFIFLFVLGTIGFAAFNNLMYSALKYTSAINVAIIQASMPLIVFILNFILFRLKATFLQMIGFSMTLIGVLLVAARGNLEILLGLAFNFGDLLMLCAIMAYGVYSVFLKNMPEIHWISFITILGSSALFSSIFFSAYELSSDAMIWPDLTGWLIILYTAIFPSLLSQVFWMLGLEIIGSNRGGVFINFVPIIGSGLAIILLGEKFHAYHAIALFLVIGGVLISQKQPAKP